MRLNSMLAVGVLGVIGLAANAEQPLLEDFSKIAPITASDQSIQRVELPFQVLLESTRSNVSDLHVFDAQGQLMPSNTYYLRTRDEKVAAEIDLQFFPFGAEADQDTIRISFQMDEPSRGTRIGVTTDQDDAINGSAKTNYVVHIPKEIRKKHGALSQLELSWVKPVENLIVPVRVEGSADLQQWQTLSERAVVSDLQHNGATLRTNTIELDGFTGAYVRLTWPDTVEQFDVQNIRGEFTRRQVTPTQLRRHRLACTQSQPDSKSDVCELIIPQQLSVHSFSVLSDLSQYFVQGTLYSSRAPSSEKDPEWVRRGVFQQYRLNVDDEELSNSALRLPNSRDRHWQLRFDQPLQDLGVTEVELQWFPVYQAFLTQGQSPYQLAYGNPRAINATRGSMDTILGRTKKRIEDVAIVYLGSVQAFERVEVYWTQQRIEVFVLWAVLLVGVGVLFRIAWTLYRGLSTARDE